jgi:predicted nucleotidyltransferase
MLRRYGVQRAGLFGSIVRGDARPESDVDLLIQPPPTMSLFGFSELALALEDLLGRRVDLVTYASLHPRLRDSVYAHYDQLFIGDLDEVGPAT